LVEIVAFLGSVQQTTSELAFAVISAGAVSLFFLFFFLLSYSLRQGAGGQAIARKIGKLISGCNILISFFLGAGEFFHDTFLSNVEVGFIEDAILIFIGHGLERAFLLIDDFVQNHLQILVG
jgi:hypothetical protein